MKEALQSQGWHLSDDGLTMLQEQVGVENATSINAITAAALDFDLRQIMDASGDALKGATRLEGPLVLQLNEVRNVAMPSTHQTEKPRLLKMHFSGGSKKKWVGVEMLGPVESIDLMTPPGTKYLVTRPIEIKSSFLMLGPGLLKPLGGHVQEMIQAWRSGKQFVKRFRGRQQGEGGDDESGPPAFVPYKVVKNVAPVSEAIGCGKEDGQSRQENRRPKGKKRSSKQEENQGPMKQQHQPKGKKDQKERKEKNKDGGSRKEGLVPENEDSGNGRKQQPKRPVPSSKEKKQPIRTDEGSLPKPQQSDAATSKSKGRRSPQTAPPSVEGEQQQQQQQQQKQQQKQKASNKSKERGPHRSAGAAETATARKKDGNESAGQPRKEKRRTEAPAANDGAARDQRSQPPHDNPSARRPPNKRQSNNTHPSQPQVTDGNSPAASPTKKTPSRRPPRNKPSSSQGRRHTHPGQDREGSDKQRQS